MTGLLGVGLGISILVTMRKRAQQLLRRCFGFLGFRGLWAVLVLQVAAWAPCNWNLAFVHLRIPYTGMCEYRVPSTPSNTADPFCQGLMMVSVGSSITN